MASVQRRHAKVYEYRLSGFPEWCLDDRNRKSIWVGQFTERSVIVRCQNINKENRRTCTVL